MTAFAASAAIAERSSARIDREWDAYRTEVQSGAATRWEYALREVSGSLSAAAKRALDTPVAPSEAFAFLAPLAEGAGERGVIVFRGPRPSAWAGRVRISPDTLIAPLGAVITRFYLTVYATATRGDTRAVATVLLHADPPADRLAQALDAEIARAAGVRGYDYALSTDTAGGFTAFAPNGNTLFGVRPSPITPSEARLRAVEDATRRGS